MESERTCWFFAWKRFSHHRNSYSSRWSLILQIIFLAIIKKVMQQIIATRFCYDCLGHPTWNVIEVVSNLQRLKWHPGFPTGKNLRCPIFLQDKFVYLKAMPHKLCLPTLKVIFIYLLFLTLNLYLKDAMLYQWLIIVRCHSIHQNRPIPICFPQLQNLLKSTMKVEELMNVSNDINYYNDKIHMVKFLYDIICIFPWT